MPNAITRERKTMGRRLRAVRHEEAPAEDRPLTEGPTCVHHWVIAAPNGEMSVGRCKLCGLEKEFPNSAEDYLWERSVPQSRWTGRADTPSGNAGY
ncbi:MAG TPA: hypothetical protein VNM91_10285 [Dehalococcoidia bacterium]|nr:hypothetical protein [Dehalococcoidia bacterium]